MRTGLTSLASLPGSPGPAGWTELADRVWPVLLFLVLIQVVADLCDAAGLFDVGAHLAARSGRGSRIRLFLLYCALATGCTWLLSIDTTAVLLAPIGLALASEVGISAVPFAFAAIWLANGASLLLPVSNLTNLLAQERLRLSAVDFVSATWVPQLVVLLVVVGVLVLRYRRQLAGRYTVPRGLPAHDPVLLRLAAAVVVLIGAAVVGGIPAWEVALGACVVLIAGFALRNPAAVTVRQLAGMVPRSILLLAVVLFAGVHLLTQHSPVLLGRLFGSGAGPAGLAWLAGTTGLMANLTNNLPAYLAAEPSEHTPARLVTVLLAVDVGPMLLAWGSLANLLWLRSCRGRGLDLSALRFGLEGLLVVPAALVGGVVAVLLSSSP